MIHLHPLQTPRYPKCGQIKFGPSQKFQPQDPLEDEQSGLQETFQNSRSAPPIYRTNFGQMPELGVVIRSNSLNN
jgi:hypothetical protein